MHDDTFAVESFIHFCDDMMIAEESIVKIKDQYRQLEKELSDLKDKIKKEDSLKRLIPLYKEMIDVINKTKTVISKESEFGIKDILPFMKNMLAPILVAAVGAGGTVFFGKKAPDSSSDTYAELGAMSAMASLIAIASTPFVFKNYKNNKKQILDMLDTEIKGCNANIELYKHCLSKTDVTTKSELTEYLHDISDKNSPDAITSKLSEKVRISSFKKQIGKIQVLPKPSSDKSKDELLQFMANDIIKFLKAFTHSAPFKKYYSKYLYMINIQETDYSDLFSITFTDYQSGMDGSDGDNAWYYDVLEIGEYYIKERFKNWHDIWSYVNTGDGDEGTFYIN